MKRWKYFLLLGTICLCIPLILFGIYGMILAQACTLILQVIFTWLSLKDEHR